METSQKNSVTIVGFKDLLLRLSNLLICSTTYPALGNWYARRQTNSLLQPTSALQIGRKSSFLSDETFI